jgi:hypothetical protein
MSYCRKAESYGMREECLVYVPRKSTEYIDRKQSKPKTEDGVMAGGQSLTEVSALGNAVENVYTVKW